MSGPSENARARFLPSVDRLEAAMHAGRKSLDAGQMDGALREVNEALRLKPEYDAAWILRGTILRRSGDPDGALASFAQALRFNRESTEGWLGLATALHDLRRHREEVEAYDELLKFHPRLLEAWINRGAALHAMKDFQGALACYEKVLAIRPEHAAAWNNKGAALLRLGREADALRCFDEALHFHPDFLDAMLNRILLTAKENRHGETVIWADRALRLQESPTLWYVKGLSHLGLLESTQAVNAFERALALDPGAREAKAGLRRAKALRETVDFYRGVYDCFGTHLDGDPGCAECAIAAKCMEVSR